MSDRNEVESTAAVSLSALLLNLNGNEIFSLCALVSSSEIVMKVSPFIFLPQPPHVPTHAGMMLMRGFEFPSEVMPF